MIGLKEYIDLNDKNHFGKWFDGLKDLPAAKITTHLERLASGNFSQVEPVGKGVLERKVDFGPGYRVYFGKDGDNLIILLAGGTKRRQQKDIENAHNLWQEYKRRKKENQNVIN